MFRWKWWVVLVWALILGGLAYGVSQVGVHTSDSISIPGTQAQVALDTFNDTFPDVGANSTKVVIASPDGTTLEGHENEINTLTTSLQSVEGVTRAVSPYEDPSAISDDKTIAFVTVQMQGSDEDGRVSEETITGIQQVMDETRSSTNLTVEAGGDLVDSAPGEILGIGEIVGVVIALIVLVVTLGTLIAAGMPLVTALVAVGVSMAGLFSLSTVIDLTNTAPVLAVMLGLAVGIDYSLFIVNRYRTLVKEGYGLQVAAGKAIATAGNAVLFAASTVVIALAALAVVQIPFMTVMGLAAAATVAIAALVSITLIPALLGIAKMSAFSRKEKKQIIKLQRSHKIEKKKVSHKTMWYHWAESLLKYRKSILLSGLAFIILLALPMTQLRLGLPTDETAAIDSSERQAYELLAEGFGDGYNGPLLVVVENVPAVSSEDTQIVQYASFNQLQSIAEEINDVQGVAKAQPALVSEDGTMGVIQVTPTTGPSNEATSELVAYLREPAHQAELSNNDAITFGVTGTTAIQIDINDKLSSALPLYLGVVIGLSLLILMVAFRSILIPLKATLGFLLSVFAMFGALVAVFQWGWFGIAEAPGPIVSFIPIIAIGILFGLAMDYEFFLVSSMQEAYHETKKPKQAIVNGFAVGSRVVVAAALIMVAVFAGFISNHDSTIQSMGFALAIGIAVDAFIVRMLIVPIVMSYLGKHAWWLPKWLDKLLPKVSIDGQ